MTAPRIALFTPSLPERHALLAECLSAIRAQTLQPAEHIIILDHERAGVAALQNRMLAVTDSEWLSPLADDDLLDPQHLETLAAHTNDGDVIYSFCRVTGRDGWNPNCVFDADRLRAQNYIPAVTLIRTSLAQQLGGWRPDAAHGFEDWDFWLRALDAGARFICIPTVTWTYRFHGGNISCPQTS